MAHRRQPLVYVDRPLPLTLGGFSLAVGRRLARQQRLVRHQLRHFLEFGQVDDRAATDDLTRHVRIVLRVRCPRLAQQRPRPHLRVARKVIDQRSLQRADPLVVGIVAGNGLLQLPPDVVAMAAADGPGRCQ